MQSKNLNSYDFRNNSFSVFFCRSWPIISFILLSRVQLITHTVWLIRCESYLLALAGRIHAVIFLILEWMIFPFPRPILRDGTMRLEILQFLPEITICSKYQHILNTWDCHSSWKLVQMQSASPINIRYSF